MLRKYLSLTIILMITVFPSWTLDQRKPLSFLGSTISDIFENPFIPEEIFPNRGPVEKDDNVVFYYSDGFYLFLYANRVWQIRYDRTFEGIIEGLHIGMDREDVLVLPGTLLKEDEELMIFQIRDTPYPVRIKLYFENEMLDDLYVYRADY